MAFSTPLTLKFVNASIDDGVLCLQPGVDTTGKLHHSSKLLDFSLTCFVFIRTLSNCLHLIYTAAAPGTTVSL